MYSPHSYTYRASSESSRALSSPVSSSSSSSWPSDAGPSSSPPMSPISYSSQHAYTTIHNSSPYFTHMNARYDRSIGREHELQRELGVERAEYGNGNGKFVSRDSGPTPPRQTLPSFKELFGDIRLLNMDSHRNISSSSSSSSTSSSLSSVSQPVIKASHSNYSRRISGSPTKPSVSLVDHIFYSSEEEDETDGYFRRRLPFRYSREPSLAEQSLSDAEEELLERDRIEDQNSYSFSPGRRRSTTFETSSERGLWTNTTRFPEIKAQKRSSEPAISLPSPLPTSDSDLGTSQSFPSPARHVSEPAPQSGLVHQGRSFVNDKSIAPSRSSPMRPREISLPASSPPMSPASSLSPIREKPSDSSPSCPDDVATVESGCPSCLEGYRSVSPPGDMVRPTEDIVMGGIDSNGDDSHETQTELLKQSLASVATVEQGLCSDAEKVVIGQDVVGYSDLSAELCGPLNDATSSTTTTIVDTPSTSTSPPGEAPEPMPPAFPFSSPLSSLPSSSRTTPSLDDLIYAMETEVAEAVVPIKVPGEEISEVGEKEAIVLRTTTSEVVNTTLPASPLLPNTSVPINEPYPTALTNRTVHTNGGKKRQSQSICTGPPTKRFRVDSGGPHFDADFFSPSLSHRAPHPHPHGHSIRPAPTSPDRVVVRVRRVGVMKAYNTKSQQRPQPQVQKHPKSKARVKKISESVKPVQEKRDTTTRYLRQQPDKVSSTSKMATKAPTKPASAGKSGTTRSRALRMIVESDSDSSDSDEEDRTKVAERRSSSPLSSVMSSETEEEENGDESADEVDSDEEEDEIVEKKAKSKLRGSAKSSKASTRTKPSSSAFPKPPSPLDPRDAEIIGLLIETMAQSRASSHTVSVLYKSLLENRAGVLVRLAEGLEPKDEEGEVEAKQKRGEKDWWMYELVRVLELGMTRCGMFGRVDSSGRDSSDRLMEAHYFYVPERDEDQERATLIRSIMPRAGKRNETKKYKQYYWKPVEGKRLRWDAVDGI